MKTLLTTLLLLITVSIFAQPPAGARTRGSGNMNVGHFYGKIVDSKTGKGVEAASVQLLSSKPDTATKKMKEQILRTLISQPNGDFSVENLPVFGNYKFKISAVGYKTLEQPA